MQYKSRDIRVPAWPANPITVSPAQVAHFRLYQTLHCSKDQARDVLVTGVEPTSAQLSSSRSIRTGGSLASDGLCWRFHGWASSDGPFLTHFNSPLVGDAQEKWRSAPHRSNQQSACAASRASMVPPWIRCLNKGGPSRHMSATMQPSSEPFVPVGQSRAGV